MKNHLVVFQPQGTAGRVTEEQTLQEAARELGVGLQSICGGRLTCGKCRVRVEEGSFPRFGIQSSMAHLSPVLEEERSALEKGGGCDGYRLACAAKVYGDVVLFVPEESRADRQIVRKSVTERAIAVKPALRQYYVELAPPTLSDPLGDWERLAAELARTFGLKDMAIDHLALRGLSASLRQAQWKATVTIWRDREVIRVEPGLVETVYGLAVDIGTTTLAGYLCDLHSGQVLSTDAMLNPQVAYGEDVMSRIAYAAANREGLAKLHACVIEGVNTIVRNAATQAGLQPEDISELVVVGNTAMHHLFLNIDPQPLGRTPFPPAVHRSLDIRARELGLNVHQSANVHVLPIEAGFVGADNVAVLIAEEPYAQDEMVLIIDIGTNGELALGNRERLLCCSCAMGPAFEGDHIRFGMRAAPGAIEKVTIDPQTLEVTFEVIGGGRARGICGSGIIDAVAEMLQAGVIDKSGRLRRGEAEGFIIARAEQTAIGGDITISQDDIRAVQLAKAAAYAGAKVLMGKLGIATLDRVILAGAFGSCIDKEQALRIGLFPDCDLERVHSVGNAAGDGARIALLNVDKRAEAERVAREVDYVELTAEPQFVREFTEAMHFPHMKDAFPHLETRA